MDPQRVESKTRASTPPAPWRWRPGRLLTFLCAALLVWLAWGAAYSLWRQPTNVFEEIYWADVDANASRELADIANFPSESAMFLASAANPLKIATLGGLGGEPYESGPVERTKTIFGPGAPEKAARAGFYRYFTQLSFEIPLAVEGYEVDDKWWDKFVIYANTQKLYIESPSLYMGTASDRPSDVSFQAEYDLSTRQLEGIASRSPQITDEEALRASALMLQAFLRAYFDSAGDASRFSPDDLGDWSWGEVKVRLS